MVVGEGLDAGKGVPREVLKDWELEVGAVVGVVGGFGGVLLLVAKDSSSQVSGVKTGDDGRKTEGRLLHDALWGPVKSAVLYELPTF